MNSDARRRAWPPSVPFLDMESSAYAGVSDRVQLHRRPLTAEEREGFIRHERLPSQTGFRQNTRTARTAVSRDSLLPFGSTATVRPSSAPDPLPLSCETCRQSPEYLVSMVRPSTGREYLESRKRPGIDKSRKWPAGDLRPARGEDLLHRRWRRASCTQSPSRRLPSK